MRNDVFIIIVTYNGMQWLSKCLESTKFYSVIVVDNNSSDDTLSYIQKNYKEVILLPQEKNLGFGRANNIGIQEALKRGCDYVFLLNQDAYLVNHNIQNLINIHKSNREYGILSPIHINNSCTRLDANFSNYISFYNNPAFISDYVLNRSVQDVYSVPFINAAAWLISRECLEIVGNFDPIFFHYGEDDNYCQRLKFHKFKIGVVTNEFVIHDRENRRKIAARPYSSEYLSLKERGYKIKFADINKNFGNDLIKMRNRLKRSVFKNFVLGRFKFVLYQLEEIMMLNRIIPEIQYSRERNKKKGARTLKA